MRRADLMVLAAALIWGAAYLAQKTAMADLGPASFVASRATVAALVLMPFALREAGALPWRIIGTGGCVWALAALIQQTGIVTASVTNTAFLTAIYVVIAPVLALALGRRPAGAVWAGAGLALAGAFCLSGGRLSAFGLGDWLVLGSAVFWAGYMMVAEAAGRHARPLGFTAGVFVTVAGLCWPIALWTDGLPGPEMWQALPEIAFVGVFSSALTFGLMAVAVRSIPAARAAVLLSTEALFAAAFAAALLGERLAPLGWLGAGLILGAVLMVQLAPSRGAR